jgi:glycosyltransferase involved in cell wall biosynthesis
MLTVASLYGSYPVDLHSTWAVPRLNAELLTSLAAARPDWSLRSFSPEARLLPGVDVVGVELPPRARARLKLWEHPIGRRVYTPKPPKRFRYNLQKWLWADAGAAELRARVADGPGTVVVCTHAEAVLAARRAMPASRIVHWLHTPVTREFLDASVTADASVVPSVAVYRDSWRRLGHQYPAPTWVIPNWIDTDRFRPPTPEGRGAARLAFGLDDDDIAVAFVGRHWIKGSQVVERALAALPGSHRRIVLLSAGEPTPRQVLLAPGREVRGLGRLPPGDLVRVYEAADLGVVPSVSEENMPLAALEMMACGLAVVASRVGGIPEVVTDGVTGRLVDLPNVVDPWRDAVAELITDVDRRAALGEAARATVLDRFTSEHACEAWMRVLNGVAGPSEPWPGGAGQTSSSEYS